MRVLLGRLILENVHKYFSYRTGKGAHMSSLTNRERKKLELLFQMNDAYVLNFCNKKFSDFFAGHRVNIDSEKYLEKGASKANRLRSFWAQEPDSMVGGSILWLIEYAQKEKLLRDESNELKEKCQLIAMRLSSPKKATPLDSQFEAAEIRGDYMRDELLSQLLSLVCQKKADELGLCYVHSYSVWILKKLCWDIGIPFAEKLPLDRLYGEYVIALEKEGIIESEKTRRALLANGTILQQFNELVLNRSLTHSCSLNSEESRIFIHQVEAIFKGLSILVQKRRALQTSPFDNGEGCLDDDVPF